MYRPTFYRNGLFDDFFDFSFPETRLSRSEKHDIAKRCELMKTDVKESENGFEIQIDIPGYAKENIEISLDKGSLTVKAVSTSSSEEKEDKTGFIRKERFTGTMSRTFFVGENLKEEDIHAKFENGVLTLNFPKNSVKEEEPKKLIAIE